MSRTLGSILLVAGAVAVNVIPGAGQFISAAILSSGLGIGSVATAVSLSASFTTGLTLAGISAGLSAAGSVIAGRPAQRADTTETSRKSPIPVRTRAYGALRLYWDALFFGNKSDGTPIDVGAFHDGRANAITQVYLNDDKVTLTGTTVNALPDGRYRDSRVKCGFNLGLPTETAFADVVAELPGIWTTDHRGDGIVTGFLIKFLTKADKFLETYPNGDDIQMSLAGEWSLVFDFRDEAQDAYDQTTWEYRDNPVLAFLHREITQGGVDFNTQILPQIDKWTAAANDCDAAMALAAGGTEPRYRLALAYKATETPAAVRLAILNTFDGWYCENERGELIIYSGRFYEPTVSIGPDKIASYSIQQHVAAEDAVNEVLITYVSAEHDYATVDAASWRDQAAIDASGREPVTIGLDAQIPSPTQGRRLAKRKMIRANAPYRGSIVTTFGGREVLGERYINLTIEEAGAVFYDGPVEIVGSPERDMQTGGVRFEWVAADPAMDDWDPSEETGDATPVGEVPDVEPLDDPEITDAVVNFDTDSGAGAPGAYLVLTATGPDRSDLTWFARTKLSTASVWGERQYSDIDPGTSVTINTEYVPADAMVDAQVSYATGDGRRSAWSDTVTVDTTTDGIEVIYDGGILS
ncbi:hypothetical protein [Sphingomonas soli]|uniref:hypothetical protein n=1 Tax=Sphingomonas soli TaxID=266127 RepID=UPI000829B17C|nr:hypothetical protein [Sphingomonas soli]